MEAGIEHLGRATAQSVDALLIVVEPSQKSVQTTHSIVGLAKDIGIPKVFAVLNKVRTGTEDKWLTDHLPDVPLIGTIAYSERVAEADLRGVPAYGADGTFAQQIRGIKENLEKELA